MPVVVAPSLFYSVINVDRYRGWYRLRVPEEHDSTEQQQVREPFEDQVWARLKRAKPEGKKRLG
jgi:hypothetical protein